MSAAVFIRSSRNDFLAERIVIFLSFACGALAAGFDLFALPALPPLRVLFGVFLGGILFLAASGFGLVLLPAAMLLFGHFSQSVVLTIISASYGNIFQEPQAFILSTLLVPFVFLAGFHGLCAASSLRVSLFRGSPTARTLYQSELASTALFVLFSLSVVFYFT